MGNGDVSKWVKNSRVGGKAPIKQSTNKKKRKEKKNLKQNAEVKSPQGLIPWVENVELKNLHILFT